jgi:hypothetical protein
VSSPLAPWVAAALALHAGLALVGPLAPPSRSSSAADPMEIDLGPPASSPAPAPPPATTPVSVPVRAPVATPNPARASTAPSRAAPILTAAPSRDEDPVSFATDPGGNAFGYGVVARDGTAMQAAAASLPPSTGLPPRPAVSPAGASTVLSDWMRAPRLDDPDPCRGFFPRHAVADVGHAALVVVIDPAGRVASTSVAEESPLGDGFGEAARTCLRTKVFTPALGRDGQPTRATATVRIRFSR